jgi:hypothetical protein
MKHFIQTITMATLLALPFITVAAAESLPPGLTAEAIAAAKTPAEHQAIADAYAKEATNLQAMADAHRKMDSYYAEPGYLSAKRGVQRHCRALVQSYEAAAKDADALAKMHHEMAEAAAKKTK